VSEYEHSEHLLDEIQRLRESNFYLREGCEELKQRIKRLEEAGDWVGNWILEHKHLIDDINKPLNKWRKAKDSKP